MNFKPLADFMNRLTCWIIPGNAVSVYYKNEEVFNYSSGYSDVKNKIPMSPDKLINIYSCSKITTATAALQLIDNGIMMLSDPLYEYIPEYREMYIKTPDGGVHKAKKAITIGNLFTMSAGLTYNTDTDGFKKARELTGGNMDTQTVAKCIALDPLSFEPGDSFQYSLCLDVLAAVVEIVSQKRFSEYVRDNIFEPVGIKNSAYHLTSEIEKKMARQYYYKVSTPYDNVGNVGYAAKNQAFGELVDVGQSCGYTFGPGYDSGGAGIITSVSEYAKLANALANFGIAKTGERVLSRGAVELMRTNQRKELFTGSPLAGYGYGLGVRTLVDRGAAGSNGTVGEFGWGGAAGANMLVDPDNGFSLFYAHHMLNPQEDYYQPRLRNAAYACLDL